MILSSHKNNWLAEQALNLPDNTAIIYDDKLISYSRLQSTIYELSKALSQNGINEFKHAALIEPDLLKAITLILVMWNLGCTPIIINPILKQREINSIIYHYNINFCVTYNKIKNDIICENIFGIENVYLDSSFPDPTSPAGYKNENAIVLFTSGASGVPKGVVHTFSNLFESVNGIDSVDNYAASDRFLLSLPLHHIGGFMIFVRSLLSGGTLCIPNSSTTLDIIASIGTYNPTVISLVPTVLKRMLDKGIKPNQALRSLYIGGGPSNKNIIIEAIQKKFPVVKVYGLTETCSMVTALPKQLASKYPESVGFPLGKNEIKIVDESKNPLNRNTTGEIIVKSNSLFSEYFRDAELTGSPRQNDFFYTGDLGYINDDNLLFIEMRREDLIVSGGENINPKEIENILLTHSNIRDAVVIPIEDDEWGQIAAAVIVPKDKSKYDDQELNKYLRNYLQGFKIPKMFFLLENIPRNEIGKVITQEIKTMIKLYGN